MIPMADPTASSIRNAIDGEFLLLIDSGHSEALSSDGAVVGIGGWLNGDNGIGAVIILYLYQWNGTGLIR